MCITFQLHICNIPTSTREDAADTSVSSCCCSVWPAHCRCCFQPNCDIFSPFFSGHKECCTSLNKFDVIEYYFLVQNVWYRERAPKSTVLRGVWMVCVGRGRVSNHRLGVPGPSCHWRRCSNVYHYSLFILKYSTITLYALSNILLSMLNIDVQMFTIILYSF